MNDQRDTKIVGPLRQFVIQRLALIRRLQFEMDISQLPNSGVAFFADYGAPEILWPSSFMAVADEN
jgi:hypothetical protein